jgi:Divergent InlB B-repeat domain
MTTTPRKGLRALLLAAAVLWLTLLCAPHAGAANPQEPIAVGKTGSGTVTSSPPGIACGTTCDASFDQGTTVTLTATPAAGYRFGSWNGCTPTSTPNVCTVTLEGPAAVTANFIATPTLKVVLAGTGSGAVTSSPAGIACGSTCSASYDVNTLVTLFATPAAGSRFAGWSGGGCAGTGSCTVKLAQTTQVTARFNAEVTLTIDNAGTGQGSITSSPSGIKCAPACSAVYDLGTKIRLAAHPARGSRFLGWVGPPCAGGLPCSFTITQNTTIGADFGRIVVPPNTRVSRLKVFRGKHGKRGRAEVWFTASGGTESFKFVCKLDKKRFRSCRSPKKYRHLRKGRHTIQVRAVDSSGFGDPTPARVKFKI